jgi:hypothetical protein
VQVASLKAVVETSGGPSAGPSIAPELRVFLEHLAYEHEAQQGAQVLELHFRNGEFVDLQLAPDLRGRLERIAGAMEMSRGHWVGEFHFQDGGLARYVRREGPVPAGALLRYEDST